MIHIHIIEFILCILGIVQFREDIIHYDNRQWLFLRFHPVSGKQE